MAFAGSRITNAFICDRISSNCGWGRVESVLEIASGQVIFGGRSTPGGNGGKPLDEGN